MVGWVGGSEGTTVMMTYYYYCSCDAMTVFLVFLYGISPSRAWYLGRDMEGLTGRVLDDSTGTFFSIPGRCCAWGWGWN